jgi:hypothetical protein
MVHEPMTDLIALMSKLVDPQGNILIPGVDEMVPPPDDEERHVSYSTIRSYHRRQSALLPDRLFL